MHRTGADPPLGVRCGATGGRGHAGQQRQQPLIALADLRAPSHDRFRNRGTEYGCKAGAKWMGGGAKRQMRPSPKLTAWPLSVGCAEKSCLAAGGRAIQTPLSVLCVENP